MLPYLDTPEMAEIRKNELSIQRSVAVELGRSAIEAANNVFYKTAAGKMVKWASEVDTAKRAKRSIAPDNVLTIHEAESRFRTLVKVANQSTLQASRRLTERNMRPLALNFANAIQPGRGFLEGALAQEETHSYYQNLYYILYS